MMNPTPSISRTLLPDEAAEVKWFAGLAMQAMISQHGIPESDSVREEIALWAFRMGQAMVLTEKRLHIGEPHTPVTPG